MISSARSSNSSGFVEASGTQKTLSGAPDRKMTQMSVFGRLFLIEKDGRPKVNSDVIWQAVAWGRPGQNACFRNRNVKTSTRNTSPGIQSSSFRIQSSHPSRSGSTCLEGLSEIHEQLELGLWVLELRLWVLRITSRLLGLTLGRLGLALFSRPAHAYLTLAGRQIRSKREFQHTKSHAESREGWPPMFDSQHPKVCI